MNLVQGGIAVASLCLPNSSTVFDCENLQLVYRTKILELEFRTGRLYYRSFISHLTHQVSVVAWQTDELVSLYCSQTNLVPCSFAAARSTTHRNHTQICA